MPARMWTILNKYKPTFSKTAIFEQLSGSFSQ